MVTRIDHYSYEVLPRPAELGGGWKLRLLIDGEEAGGGVFPADPTDQAATDDAYTEAVDEGESWVASIERRAPEYRPRRADDGGGYRLMPDDRLLTPSTPAGKPERVIIEWTPDQDTKGGRDA